MNNVVGKMLIVMQLVFSILFMCFAGAVYTFQGQWRNKAGALTTELADAQKNYDDAKASHDRDKTQWAADLEKMKVERDNFRAELENAHLQSRTNQALLAAASLERDKAMADATVASTEASARVVESTALNKEVQSLRDRIAQLIDEIQSTEDELLDKTGRLVSATEMEEQRLGEIGRLNDLLRLNDIDPGQAVVGIVPAQIEKIDGVVNRTTRNKSRTQEFVEITIGSDDKVYKNMMLTVFREDKYICKARVLTVYPDSAICVVEETSRQGNIERGDNVTTKL